MNTSTYIILMQKTKTEEMTFICYNIETNIIYLYLKDNLLTKKDKCHSCLSEESLVKEAL